MLRLTPCKHFSLNSTLRSDHAQSHHSHRLRHGYDLGRRDCRMGVHVMTPEVAAALEASIDHWDKLSRAEIPETVSIGVSYCALCRIFHPSFGPRIGRTGGCDGCPVHSKTDKSFCQGTPFIEADAAFRTFRWNGTSRGSGKVFRSAAAVERDFLISLRESVDKTTSDGESA